MKGKLGISTANRYQDYSVYWIMGKYKGVSFGLVLLIFGSLSITTYGQNRKLGFTEAIFENIEIDSASKDSLTALVLHARKRHKVYGVTVDSSNNSLIIKVRNEKRTALVSKYDLMNNYWNTDRSKFFWSKKTTVRNYEGVYYPNDLFVNIGGYLYYKDGESFSKISSKDGEIEWTQKGVIKCKTKDVFVTTRQYENPYSKKKVMHVAVDPLTGDKIWGGEFPGGEWFSFLELDNEDGVVFLSEGMHKIYLTDGSGWTLGRKIWTKSFLNGYRYAALSNIVSDSTGYYFCSKKWITHLDNNGKILWETELPKKKTSRSTIAIKGDTLWMMNHGANHQNFMSRIPIGEPFLKAFDKKSGKELIDQNFKGVGNIRQVKYKNYYLECIYEKGIFRIYYENPEEIRNKLLIKHSRGYINYYVPDELYLEDSENGVVQLKHMDSVSNFIYTGKGKLLLLNEDLDVKETQRDFDQTFFELGEIDDLLLLSNGNKLLVVDTNGYIVFKVKVKGRLGVMADIFYAYDEDKFWQFNLREELMNRGLINIE